MQAAKSLSLPDHYATEAKQLYDEFCSLTAGGYETSGVQYQYWDLMHTPEERHRLKLNEPSQESINEFYTLVEGQPQERDAGASFHALNSNYKYLVNDCWMRNLYITLAKIAKNPAAKLSVDGPELNPLELAKAEAGILQIKSILGAHPEMTMGIVQDRDMLFHRDKIMEFLNKADDFLRPLALDYAKYDDRFATCFLRDVFTFPESSRIINASSKTFGKDGDLNKAEEMFLKKKICNFETARAMAMLCSSILDNNLSTHEGWNGLKEAEEMSGVSSKQVIEKLLESMAYMCTGKRMEKATKSRDELDMLDIACTTIAGLFTSEQSYGPYKKMKNNWVADKTQTH